MGKAKAADPNKGREEILKKAVEDIIGSKREYMNSAAIMRFCHSTKTHAQSLKIQAEY